MSKADKIRRAVKNYSRPFTLKEFHRHLEMAHPGFTFGPSQVRNLVAFHMVDQGLVKKAGKKGREGIYQYVGTKAKTSEDLQVLSMEQIGEAVFDYIQKLKLQMIQSQEKESQTITNLKNQIKGLQLTVGKLNKTIEEKNSQLDRQRPPASTKTFPLSELATFR